MRIPIKHLVILAHVHHEQHSSDNIEIMDPLFPIAIYPTKIRYPVRDILERETRLGDSTRNDPTSQYVLVRRNVPRCCDAINRAEKIHGRLVQRKFVGSTDGSLYTRILPESTQGLDDVGKENVTFDQLSSERIVLWCQGDFECF